MSIFEAFRYNKNFYNKLIWLFKVYLIVYLLILILNIDQYLFIKYTKIIIAILFKKFKAISIIFIIIINKFRYRGKFDLVILFKINKFIKIYF